MAAWVGGNPPTRELSYLTNLLIMADSAETPPKGLAAISELSRWPVRSSIEPQKVACPISSPQGLLCLNFYWHHLCPLLRVVGASDTNWQLYKVMPWENGNGSIRHSQLRLIFNLRRNLFFYGLRRIFFRIWFQYLATPLATILTAVFISGSFVFL